MEGRIGLLHDEGKDEEGDKREHRANCNEAVPHSAYKFFRRYNRSDHEY